MAAHREGHESGCADQGRRGLPPRRRHPSFGTIVVGRYDENEEHEYGDQSEANDRPDTETRVEHATPDIGVDQTRPVGRLEIHTLYREVHEGGQSEHDE